MRIASARPSKVGYSSHAVANAPALDHGVLGVLSGGFSVVETEITELSSLVSSGIGFGPAGFLLVLGR